MRIPFWLLIFLPVLGLVIFSWCYMCYRIGMWMVRFVLCERLRPPSPPVPPAPARLAPVAAPPRYVQQRVVPVVRPRRGSSGGALVFAILIGCFAMFLFGNYRNEQTRARAVREQARAQKYANRKQPPQAQVMVAQAGPGKDVDQDDNVEIQIPNRSGDEQASWVTGFGTTREDAIQDAVDKAHDKILIALSRQMPNLQWLPSQKYVGTNLVKDPQYLPSEDRPGLGTVRKVRLRVEVTAEEKSKILQMDRRYRVEQRMLLVAKGLGVLVLLLAAVAAYIRLDEFSKGYYTLWLRLAGLLAAVVAVGAFFFTA